MDLLTLIQNIRELIAAARDGDYLKAVRLAVTIFGELIELFPVEKLNREKLQAESGLEGLSNDDLLCKLEDLIEPSGLQGQSMTEAPKGPFVEMAIAIILSLLNKWFIR